MQVPLGDEAVQPAREEPSHRPLCRALAPHNATRAGVDGASDSQLAVHRILSEVPHLDVGVGTQHSEPSASSRLHVHGLDRMWDVVEEATALMTA